MDNDLEQALTAAGVPADQTAGLLDLARAHEEKLLPELMPYVETGGVLGTMLKHPLVFQVPLVLPGLANQAYRDKKKALARAISAQDWGSIVFLHERAYRCEALVRYVIGRDEMGTARPLVDCTREQREIATRVWLDSENIHQAIEDWDAMFAEWNPGDDLLLDDDPEAWAALDDPLTVYRAGIDDGGWSWTLDPKVAVFFARRFDERHPMTVGTLAKRHVFGYITSRSESEILCLEGSVTDQRPYEG